MGLASWILLAFAVGTACVGLGLLLLGRGRRLPRGRLGRMARIGRLSARLATSRVGAAVRRAFTPRSRRARYDAARRARDAAAVTRTMGEMKGAFMKLGQMMSFVSEDVPAEYRAALASLQAQAPAMDFALIRDTVERELERPLERAFARFDERPLASASIGQVHRARLPTGEEVVVKVQYPGVADAIAADLANMSVMYRVVGLMYPALDPKPVVEELRARITEELDYAREAANQQAFRDLYAGHPRVRIPAVYPSHSTARVLTTEYVDGRPFDHVLGLDQATRDDLAEVMYRFVFGSIIRHGVFNGDPHPGNYLFTDDGKVVFLDFGCVKYFPDAMLRGWMDMVRTHLAGRPDAFRALAVQLGFFPADSPLSADLVYDYFAYFYEPIREDRPFTFSRAYNARSLGMVFRPDGRFAGMTKAMNMPADFVFVNRIQWGVFSILAQLGATRNWHAIHREYLFDEPPRAADAPAAAAAS